eukprot:TRINITY_DN19327_c0_g1_i1.p1 TRINITY_DN19327_c0_g1~~TRINITY_DN19327_c0_g1_i1.p1  ORF type:complete len:109 (-),score=15.83 TRINITY_DN19327_c0_g1_i1:3-329(-)
MDLVQNSRGLSQVTGVLFSIEQEGTLALCELNFSTDLVEIDSASVSCQILYDNIGDSIVLGLVTDYDWTFFAKIGDEVFDVKASITLIHQLEQCQVFCSRGRQGTQGV